MGPRKPPPWESMKGLIDIVEIKRGSGMEFEIIHVALKVACKIC